MKGIRLESVGRLRNRIRPKRGNGQGTAVWRVTAATALASGSMLALLATTQTSAAAAATGTAPAAVTSAVFDNASSAAWTGSEATGSAAYDTAAVNGSGGPTPTGTVTYTLFDSADCSGSPATGWPLTVTLNADGTVPNSAATNALGAGSYSYQAVYSGDSNYAGSPGGCEPFAVAKIGGSTAATIDDATTNTPWTGNETVGASAYEASLVSSIAGFPPTGTVEYDVVSGGCAGTIIQTQTVNLNPDGTVPDSKTTGPLGAGNYCFHTYYSGDSNYLSSATFQTAGAFTVNGPTIAVYDASTQSPWAGNETSRASAYATATVVGGGTTTPTGTLTYNLFANQTCSGAPTMTSQVNINADGTVPSSTPTGALAFGPYSYQASYSGDANYSPSATACQPFSVTSDPSSTTTAVNDASTNSAWSNTEISGASAFATSTVTGLPGIAPTGTVTYSLFQNGTCSGTPAATSQVAVGAASLSTGALEAGLYSYEASYSGDGTYSASTGNCQAFPVASAASAITTAVLDGATNSPWNGGEATGASAYDTATVTGRAETNPTGTVTYALFNSQNCSGPQVGASQPVTLNADGTVPASPATGPLAAGQYSYLATYSGDPTYALSTAACEPFAVLTAASVTAMETSSPVSGSSIAPGGSITYTVSLSNTGQEAATGVSVSAAVPTGTTLLSATNGGANTGGLVTWTGLNVPTGTTSVSFSVKVNAGAANGSVVSSTATFTNAGTPGCTAGAPTCTTNAVTATVRFPVVVGHETVIPASGAEVERGGVLTYAITASNAGLASDPSVTIAVTTPVGTTYLAGSARCPAAIKCVISTQKAAAGATRLQWVFPLASGTVGQGGVTAYTAGVSYRTVLAVSSAACTSITNQALVNGVPTNVVSEYEVYPSVHLSVSAVPATGRVVPGQVISYTIHWSNTGSADAKSATVADTIPTWATYRAGSVREGGRGQGPNLVWSGLELPAGRSGVLTFQVIVNRTDRVGTRIVDAARISSQISLQPTMLHPAGCRAPGAVAKVTPALSATSNQTVHTVVS